MLTLDQFSVLHYLINNSFKSQRDLSDVFDFSLGKVNLIYNYLKDCNYIDDNNQVTKEGKDALLPYKVDNAVIMAAGMSSRFAPLSYEKPKGVLVVKGEVLIERQIRQLQEVGITDITVVVGYMKEKFFYLEEKYGVDIVINEDYYRYNNTSTLIRVTDKLKNTYICSSDNYFVENPFEQYVYDSYYSAIFIPGKSEEWGLKVNNKGIITEIVHNPDSMWCMLGHVFFSNSFSKKFVEILENTYDLFETRNGLWESLYEKHIKELSMMIRKYDSDVIKEFDSLEELRQFDDKYLTNSGSKIFTNICNALKCEEKDIVSIEVIKRGVTNLSFKFSVNNIEYVYRHPGFGTEKYVDRKSEASSEIIAKEIGLDKTFVYMDANEGWKITKYLNDARNLNYDDSSEVLKAINMLKKLHMKKVDIRKNKDIIEKTKELEQKITNSHKDFEDFESLKLSVLKLYEMVKKDNVEKTLCHGGFYNQNILTTDIDMNFIDWEYSGMDDPMSDIGTFICCSNLSESEALNVINLYYDGKATKEQIRHAFAYVAIASYYWYIWSIYQETLGNIIGQDLFKWYKTTKQYLSKVYEMVE